MAPVLGQQGGGVERSRTGTAGDSGLGEHYYCGLKQYGGIEKAPVRAARAQRNHIGCALRAFLRLDVQRWHTARNWILLANSFGGKKAIFGGILTASADEPTPPTQYACSAPNAPDSAGSIPARQSLYAAARHPGHAV
jgi:hypothetical protein